MNSALLNRGNLVAGGTIALVLLVVYPKLRQDLTGSIFDDQVRKFLLQCHWVGIGV